MLSHMCPWKVAQETDAHFQIYLDRLPSNFGLFEKYAPPIKALLVSLINLVWNDETRPGAAIDNQTDIGGPLGTVA
jgi:hypothetical protein